MAERRRGDFYSSESTRRKKKFKDVLNEYKYGDYYDYDDYYNDYSNAFGYGDYNTQFREAVKGHYDKSFNQDFYDYEDYSYSQFFKKTFSPNQQSAESQVKIKTLPTPDGPAKSKPSNSNALAKSLHSSKPSR